jgi:hypothetical protein
MAYSPLFTTVCFDPKSNRFGFRKLALLEIPLYAMGIKFPSELNENDGNFFTDLRALRDSQYVKQRPLIVFPEATKTNGRGVLNFEADVTSALIKAATQESGMRLHTIRFDYEFEYVSPYNSTDVKGVRSALRLMTQFRNVMHVQYYFNLEEKLRPTSAT